MSDANGFDGLFGQLDTEVPHCGIDVAPDLECLPSQHRVPCANQQPVQGPLANNATGLQCTEKVTNFLP